MEGQTVSDYRILEKIGERDSCGVCFAEVTTLAHLPASPSKLKLLTDDFSEEARCLMPPSLRAQEDQ